MRHIFFTACFVSATFLLPAQDFHLTHYDAAKIYLNPAMTGMFDGYYRIHANYRNQWSAVTTHPYQTAALAFDMPVKRYGVGVQLMNNRAGLGNFNELSMEFSAAYDLQLDKNNIHHVAFGMEAGAIQKSVDFGRLTWDNQYSLADGGFNTSTPSGENYNTEQRYLLDVSAGTMYYYAKDGARINPFIGIAAFHINQPTETFFGNDNKLPVRWVMHSGTRIGINERLQLQARLLYMQQKNDHEAVVGLLANIFLPNSESYLIVGPTFRSKDAGIFEVGLKHGQFTYRLSYDVNVSTLKPATNYRGGIEFSLIYIAKRKTPVVAPNCPRLI